MPQSGEGLTSRGTLYIENTPRSERPTPHAELAIDRIVDSFSACVQTCVGFSSFLFSSNMGLIFAFME